MKFSLEDKKIVVVGGTGGIGLAASEAFIENGAKVVAIGRKESSCREANQLFGSSGICHIGDACEEDTVVRAIDKCLNSWGDFNGIYHVAGGSGRRMGDGPLDQMTLEGWEETVKLNLTSLMLSNRAAIQAFMRLGKGGTILNMSSVLGYSPAPKYFSTHAYAAAKSAVLGFSKSIAAFYAKDSIRVNVIAPALVQTSMAERASENSDIVHYIQTKQPLEKGRIGLPGDLVGAACYFMSDLSCFTTGQILSVDGGWGISEGQF